MSDAEIRAGFLRDILANPDDDGPRLVFADWLTQRGDPRGELIVTQIQLEAATGGERARLFNRAYTLQTTQDELLADIKQVVRGVETRRGFIYSITATASVFARSCAPWFEREPIEELRLMKPTVRDLTTLRHAEHTSRLRSLVFLDAIKLNVVADVGAFADLVPRLKLRNLELRIAAAGGVEEALRGVFSKLALPALQSLRVRIRATPGSSVAAGLAAAKLPALRQLVVPRDAVGDLTPAFPAATVTANAD